MTTITEIVQKINGKVNSISRTLKSQEFAVVDEICKFPNNWKIWVKLLTGERRCPYISCDEFDNYKLNQLVIYESFYTEGENGQSERLRSIDIDKLERDYFN